MQLKPRRSQLLHTSRRPSQRTFRARQVTHVVVEDRLVGFGDTDEADAVTAVAAPGPGPAEAEAEGADKSDWMLLVVVAGAAVGGLSGRR